jgi:hypothetical protein
LIEPPLAPSSRTRDIGTGLEVENLRVVQRGANLTRGVACFRLDLNPIFYLPVREIMEATMQANAPLRTIQVSVDTFAAIWADRRAGENSEEEILRRKFNLEAAPGDIQAAPPLANRRTAGGPGYQDRRSGVRFAEGFEIFRPYKGSDYSAKACSGAWLLMNTGDLYPSLNSLSKAIGAREDAWLGWRYRDNEGKVHPIAELRDESKITKRRRILRTA